MKTIESIQALRGIAAMAVLFFHFKNLLITDTQLKKALDLLFNNGFVGVDLFFIISGFLMVLITRKLKKKETGGGGLRVALVFLKRRVMRIWPVYVIATIVHVLLTYRFQLTKEVSIAMLKSIFYLPLDSTTPPFYGYASLPVGWTLNYEFYFYFFISFSLIFRKFRWWILAAIHGGLYLLAPFWDSISLLFTSGLTTLIEPFILFPSTPIYINFLLGILAGFSYIYPAPYRLFCKIFQPIWPFLLLWGVFGYKYITGYHMDHGPMAVGWILFLAFMSTIFYFETKNIKIWRPLLWLGDVSFSIYLWHLTVQSFLISLLLRAGLTDYLSQGIFLVASIICTLLIAFLSHRYLENIFRVNRANTVIAPSVSIL
ncbi:acyltransferase family protein [Dyadobacter tibetensis]|uniref:acyltransferase family protein n=1 Tax=Dyadobacter tibetensis TaxID=1211851 RepID=UPI0004719C3F|nr:acyltransferase [Dyadobacter tibetensis]